MSYAMRPSRLLLALLLSAPLPPAAMGDTVGIGDFTLDVHVSQLPFTFDGSLAFDDVIANVFGTDVNLGTAVGTMTHSGTFTLVFSQGQFFGHFASTTLGLLAYDAGGSFICSGSCVDGLPVSFVGDVSTITGSALSALPVGLAYTGDGTLRLDGGHFVGRFAINAFQTSITDPSPLGCTGPDCNVTLESQPTFFNSQTDSESTATVDVTFSEVTGGGSTSVTAYSNAAGELPSNFSLGNLPPTFFDVSTTATVIPPITICIGYTELVANTGVDESSLALLHKEGGVFVDRTKSLDTVNDVICGEVSSLSFFAIAVGENANARPDCSGAVASPATLWAPDHGFLAVSVEGVTDPDGDPVATMVTGVSQDEPVNGGSAGNTCPDATGLGTPTASLRSERSGNGDGRVYAVSFGADDGHGGQCNGTVTVCVPHDQRPGVGCVDQGLRIDSTGTGPCS